MKIPTTISMVFGITGLLLIAAVSFAGDDKAASPDLDIRPLPFEQVDIDQFTSETQRGTPDPDRLLLIWWIPVEFWEVTFAQDKDMSEEETREFIELMEPYILIAVVDAELGMFGNATYRSMRDLKKSVRLIDKKGKQVRSLTVRDVDGDVQILLNTMKPILSSLIGPMGEHMYFFVYPRESAGEDIIGSCAESGRLTVAIDGERYHFNTPLPSLIEQKICRVCDHRFRGDYNFCPYDSTQLRYE